ncbi:hypothetical protein DWB77_05021 [Streptomyces hundungensis]|uniref:FHA domain-containing protein n=1 Tax=Streptomyces hundungensis TaxID=1077946 RepID=A0A387HKP2_9ACTN|nr:FHA domain-containing protein [Streptomyces hundungensis]AYG82833.1 hypothetical protein DWB77_05021 [Streptomyces hundungensis]
MPTCPNGHQSGSDDWCEICGHRMGAVPPPPPPPPAYGYPGPGDPNATAQAELCPQCRTPREPGAPFCEECRWNFLTNTATSYTPLAPQQPMPPPGPGPAPGPGPQLPPAFQQGPPPAPRDPYEYQSSRPSQVNRAAEPLAAEPSQRPGQQLPPNPFQQQPPQPFNGAQGGPPPPPPSFQRPTPPAPPQVQQPPADDDWMLPPPSQPAQGPGRAPATPERAGDDDWPLPVTPPAPERGGEEWPQPVAPPAPERGGDDWPQPVAPPGPERGGDDWPHPATPPAPERGGEEWPRPVTPPAPAAWSITIGPDRDYFLAMMQRSGPEAAGLNLPAYSPEQQRPLSGNQITIGRRRHSTGEAPDIDLSVPPEDPGVSHQHAVLVQQPDGTWAVVDQNSTNGTTVNGASEPIQPYVPVPLQDGDRVHVGAWTTITVRRG